MYKALTKLKLKQVVGDVLDSNKVAESSPDNIPSSKVPVLNKNKCCEDKPKDKHCKDCQEEPKKFEKTEDFVKALMDNLDVIKKAYQMHKAKVDQGLSPNEKRRIRPERKEGFTPHSRDAGPKRVDGKVPFPYKERQKLLDKVPKRPSKEDLEYPTMAASEEKPFHGYNKEKHSSKGGLSAKAREKYNRENNSNLQAPVSSKEAKKSPKKAARRKSFCARMSGVKGKTSKDGKLTPKGAALKRWDC